MTWFWFFCHSWNPFPSKIFCGPCHVVSQVSEQNYLTERPNKRKSSKACHINLLKPYHVQAPLGEDVQSCPALMANDCMSVLEEGVGLVGDGVLQPQLKNSESLAMLDILLGHLEDSKCKQLVDLIQDYPGLFSDTPTRTHLVEHDVEVRDAKPITQQFYWISPKKRRILDSKVSYMLDNCIAEPSSPSWASPCLLVSKPDNTYRPCTDYRKINAVTKPDSFPLPWMEDCVDQVGVAKCVSKFDLLKGYWQVSLSKRAREICAFQTPSGLYSYTAIWTA